MGKRCPFVLFFLFAVCLFNVNTYVLADEPVVLTAQATDEIAGGDHDGYEDDVFVDDEFDFQETAIIEDNAESFNRSMFDLNDTLYYHLIKPLNKGYNAVMPNVAKMSVRKFFLNIGTPGRLLNCLFQGKFRGAGTELARFVINSSMGVAGTFDPASKLFNLKIQDEDFGQTLARYGMDNGTYLVWPGLGPSSVRDTVGFIGDTAMNPLTFISFFITPYASLGKPYNTVNNFALDEGEFYESVTEGALDPYIAVQNAYIQNRNKKIEE